MSDWLSILKNEQADDDKIETYYEGLMKKFSIVRDTSKEDAYTSRILENAPLAITDSDGETVFDTDSEFNFSNIKKPTSPRESREYPAQLALYQDKIEEFSQEIPRKKQSIIDTINFLSELKESESKWKNQWKNISEDNPELRKKSREIVKVLNKLVNRINGLKTRRDKLDNLENKLKNLGIEENDEDEEKRKSLNFNYETFLEDMEMLKVDVESLSEFADDLYASELIEPDLFMEGNNLAFHDDDNILEDLDSRFRIRIARILKSIKSNTKNKSIMQLLFSEAEYPFGRLYEFLSKDAQGEHLAIPFAILGEAFLSKEDIKNIPKTIKDKDGDTIDNPEYEKKSKQSKEAIKKLKERVGSGEKVGVDLNLQAMEFIIELDSNPIINEIKELDNLEFKLRNSDKMVKLQDILAEATIIFDDVEVGSKSRAEDELSGVSAIKQFISGRGRNEPLNFDIAKLVKSIEEFKKNNSSMIQRKKLSSQKIGKLLDKDLNDILVTSGESSGNKKVSEELREMDEFIKESISELSKESEEIKAFRVATQKKLNEARRKVQRTKEGKVVFVDVIDPETKTGRKTNTINADIGNIDKILELENEINDLNKKESDRKKNIEAFLDSILVGAETLPKNLPAKFAQLFSTIEVIKEPLREKRRNARKIQQDYLDEMKKYREALDKYKDIQDKKRKLNDRINNPAKGNKGIKDKQLAQRELKDLERREKTPSITDSTYRDSRKPLEVDEEEFKKKILGSKKTFEKYDKKYKTIFDSLDNKIKGHYDMYLKTLKKDEEFLEYLNSQKVKLDLSKDKDENEMLKVIKEIETEREKRKKKARTVTSQRGKRAKVTGQKVGEEKQIKSLLQRKAAKIELVVAKQSVYEILYKEIAEALEEYSKLLDKEIRPLLLDEKEGIGASNVKELDKKLGAIVEEDTRKSIEELRNEFKAILTNEKEIAKGFEFRLFGEGNNKFLSSVFESLINENDKIIDSYIKTSKTGDVDFKEATAFFSINASKFEEPLKLFKSRLDTLNQINDSASKIYNLSDVIKKSEDKLRKALDSKTKESANEVSGYTELETLAVKINNIGRLLNEYTSSDKVDEELGIYKESLMKQKEILDKASKEISKGLKKIETNYSYSIIEKLFQKANGDTEEVLEEVEEELIEYNRGEEGKIFAEREDMKERKPVKPMKDEEFKEQFSNLEDDKLRELIESVKRSRKRLAEQKKKQKGD